MVLANNDPVCYQIRVKGSLDREWAGWLDNADISYEQEITVLTCPVADQAALQGLLRRLYSLGLTLISVNPIKQ